MYKKTVKYTDYNGNERSEDFYFNLTKAEMAEMELTFDGGSLGAYLEDIVKSNRNGEMYLFFKDFVLKAYGKKSEDGRRFIKNAELREEFEQSAAFSELMYELATNENATVEMFTYTIPEDVRNMVDEQQAHNRQTVAPS